MGVLFWWKHLSTSMQLSILFSRAAVKTPKLSVEMVKSYDGRALVSLGPECAG